ncbi:hypothetical protein [Sphingobacterium sp.]|uniref:hypothetical protein n=1 Tax=Sphingobacterium sp. TaxID=341027 RepID=UPI0028AA9F4C|nr:hypothetical protein [Sphingobacterium sp.]
MEALEVLIPISFFACIVLCTFFISKYRSETITKLGGPIPRRPGKPNSWKKIGVVVIGFALGSLLSGLLFAFHILNDSDWDGFIIIGLISLTVGVSLIIADKQDKKEENSIDG